LGFPGCWENWVAARAAGLLDDYANLVATVGHLKDRPVMPVWIASTMRDLLSGDRPGTWSIAKPAAASGI